MTAHPRVSAIVPARNAARFLMQALDSVLSQTLLPDELIVLVDPSSTDATVELAHAYAEKSTAALRIEVVVQQGAGIAAAWNQAIARATGELLAFLSADDRWTPDKLALQVAHLMERPTLLLVVARFRYFVEPGCALRTGFNPALLDRDLDGRIMETLVARRAAFERIGSFDEAMKVGEDTDWYARASDLRVPIDLLPRVLLHKRVHDDNLSSNATTTTPLLMQALKRSIDRKRAASGAGGGS